MASSVKLETMKTSSNEIVPCCDCSMTLALNRFKIIPVYDGTTPFEPFKQEIDFVKKMIPQGAEKLFATVIFLKLTGAAFTAAQNHEFRDIEELLSFLKARFDPPTRPYLQIVLNIVQSKMNQDEEVKAYHERLSKLVKEAEEVLQNSASSRGKKGVNHREHLELLALQAFLKGIPEGWQTPLSHLMQRTFNEALIEVMNYEKELGIVTELRRDNWEQCLNAENNVVTSDDESNVSIDKDNIKIKQNNNNKSNGNDFEDSNNSEEGPFRSATNKLRINSRKLKRGFGFFTVSTGAGENLIKEEALKSNVPIDHSQSFPLKGAGGGPPLITLGTVTLSAYRQYIQFQVLPAGNSLEEDGVIGIPFIRKCVGLLSCDSITFRNRPDKIIPLYSIPLKEKVNRIYISNSRSHPDF